MVEVGQSKLFRRPRIVLDDAERRITGRRSHQLSFRAARKFVAAWVVEAERGLAGEIPGPLDNRSSTDRMGISVERIQKMVLAHEIADVMNRQHEPGADD